MRRGERKLTRHSHTISVSSVCIISSGIIFLSSQNFNKVIAQRAVAYLNVDILLEGHDFMRFLSSPMLHTLIYNTAKKVRSDPMGL